METKPPPQDRPSVPSFPHRAWLAGTSLSPHMEEEGKVWSGVGPVSLFEAQRG